MHRIFSQAHRYRSSSLVKTFPQGLDGLQTIIALTPCLNASPEPHGQANSGGIRGHKSDWRRIKGGVSPVILIKWGKYDYIIPWVTDGHHRSHHRLGSAAGHDDLFIGINRGRWHHAFLPASRKFSSPERDTVLVRPLSTAALARASVISFGGSKSGNPCDKLIEPSFASLILVILLMTESVNIPTRSLNLGIIFSS